MNKRAVIAAAVAVPVVAAAELVVLGAKGGLRPLKFLKDRKMAKLPGNNAMYHPQYINTEGCTESPLRGKRVLFLGSSVTEGTASLGVSMADYLALQDGCEVVKEAVRGTTLADIDGMSYLARLKKLDPAQHFDAIVVQLSTNDATKKLPLGEIGAGTDKAGFDVSTVTGAMEFIIAYVKETWGCPVLFYTNARYDSEAYAAMVRRLTELRDKWGIGILDLWSSDSFNGISERERALYMADPIHPTKAGYREWWCPVLEQQLLAYLEEIG